MADNITLRLFRWGDLPAVVELSHIVADVDQMDERYDLDAMREELTAFNDPERDCFVAVLPDGRIVGYAYRELRRGEDRLWGFGWGAVHPDYRRQGIGTQLVRATDAQFIERVSAEDAGDKVIFMQRFLRDTNPDEIAIAVNEGYKELRSSYRMMLPLDRPFAPVTLPEGFVLRPFDRERDAEAVFEVDQSSFMDGGGQPNRQPYDEWAAYHFKEGFFNPALWLVAMAGDEIAGICINEAWGPEQPDLCWVARLGVLRPWRGRGLGEALLRHSFYVIQQQGYKRAGLGVRADRPGTVALYQRAGMQIYCRFIHYRKVLRGNDAEIES